MNAEITSTITRRALEHAASESDDIYEGAVALAVYSSVMFAVVFQKNR